MRPFISFIIPVYNCETYIERCVNSILEANWLEKTIQIILINDGSDDDSLQICNTLSSRWPNVIEVYSQNNAGASAARNRGLFYANGEFIWFVDADDRINTIEVPSLVSELLNSKENVFCFNYFEETISTEREIRNIQFPKIVSTKQYLLKSHSLYLWDKIYRYSIIRGTHFLEGTKNIEDFLFNIEVLIDCDYIKLVNKSIYIYNTSNIGSTSRNRSMRNLVKLSQDTIQIHTKLISLYRLCGKEENETISKLLAFSIGGYLFSLLRYYNNRYIDKAINFYIDSGFFPFPYTGHFKMNIFLWLFNNTLCRGIIKGTKRIRKKVSK